MSTKRFSFSKGIISLMIMFVAVIALVACTGNTDQKTVDDALNAIGVTYQTGDTSATITKNITLPAKVGEVTVEWTSSNTAVISNAGVVTRGQANTVVSLTAKLTLGKVSETKVFSVTVLAAPVVINPADALAALAITGTTLEYNDTNKRYTTSTDVVLPATSQTLAVTWTSGNAAVISNAGVVVRPAWGTPDSTVILTAKIGEETRDFAVTVLAITVKPASAKLSAASDALLLAGTSSGVAADITLPLTAGSEGVVVSWATNNADVLTAAGVVTRQPEQVTVKLTATLTIDGESVTKEFDVVVLPFAESTTVASLAAAVTGGKGQYVKVLGVTIVGRSSDGYLVFDGTTVMFAYTGGEPAANVVAGDVVDITGFTDYYNGSFQFNSTKDPNTPVIIKPSTAAKSVLTPKVVTDIKAYIAALPAAYTEASPLVYEYLEITGKIVAQDTTNYGTFIVDLDHDGTKINSDANSPFTTDALMIYYKSNMAALKDFNNARVTIKVFLYSLRTDRNIYTFAFVGEAADIVALPLTDQESVDGAKATILADLPRYVVENKTITLPKDLLGTTTVWTSSHDTVINATTGVVTRVEDAQTEVTLTAVITKGAATTTEVILVKVGVPPVSTMKTVVNATTNSTLYTVKGIVTSSEYYRTYFIQSGDFGIAVYTGDSAMLATLKANLGKEVQVIGTRAEHNGLRQMAPQYVTAVGEATMPAAVNVDNILLGNTMLPYQGRLVTLTQLQVTKAEVDTHGNTTLTLLQLSSGNSITMKWDARVTLSTEAAATLAGIAVNDVLDVTTVMAWSKAPYLYFTDSSVVAEVALTDASKVAIDAAALVVPEAFTEAGTLVLPAVGANGSTITWTTDTALITLPGGAVAMPATGGTTVTVTATLSSNGATKVVVFDIRLGEPAPFTLATASYTGTVNSNMLPVENNAASINLDPAIFSVTATNGAASALVGLNLAGQIRIYGEKTVGDGNTLTVAIAEGYTITKVSFVFGPSTKDPAAELTLGEAVSQLETADLTDVTQAYRNLSITAFSLKNNAAGGTSNAQVWITSIAIEYHKNPVEGVEGKLATDLFISAYVEGAPGNRKAIQIFNGTGAAVVLDGVYSLKTASNGGAWPETPILLVGTIAHGEVYVIVQSTDGGWTADLTAAMNFNGDDAVGLFKNGVLLDHFGTQGTDPGTSWTVGTNVNATVDHVLVRNNSITGPTNVWDQAEWTVALAIPSAGATTTDAAVEIILQSYVWTE